MLYATYLISQPECRLLMLIFTLIFISMHVNHPVIWTYLIILLQHWFNVYNVFWRGLLISLISINGKPEFFNSEPIFPINASCNLNRNSQLKETFVCFMFQPHSALSFSGIFLVSGKSSFRILQSYQMTFQDFSFFQKVIL
jgi:hypothetical protein